MRFSFARERRLFASAGLPYRRLLLQAYSSSAEPLDQKLSDAVQRVIDAAAHATLVIDRDGIVCRANSATHALLGGDPAGCAIDSFALVGENRARLASARREFFARTYSRASFTRLAVTIAGADGAAHHVEITLGGFNSDDALFALATVVPVATSEVDPRWRMAYEPAPSEMLREHEHRLELVFNSARDMMLVVGVEPGPRFRVLSVNRQYLQTVQSAGFAVSAADLIGRTFEEVLDLFGFSASVASVLLGRYREVVRTRNPLRYEEITETPRGTFYGDTTITPVVGEDGVCRYVLYSSADITARKQAERALAASERTLRTVLDQSFQFISLLDTEGRVLRLNRTALDVIGAELAEVEGCFFWDTPCWSHSPAEQEKVRAAVARAAAGEAVRFETTYRAADGRLLQVDLSLKSVRDDAQQSIALVAEGRDISEIRAAERALRDSTELITKAFRASPNSISVHEMSTGRYLDVNEGFERLTGYRREEVLGRTPTQLGFWLQPEDRERFIQMLLRNGSVRGLRHCLRNARGEELTVLMSAESVEVGGRRCNISVFEDITEQVRSEQALRESEEKFSKAFRASPGAMGLSDVNERRFIDVNDGYSRMFGYSREEMIGRSVDELGLWESAEEQERFFTIFRRDGAVREREMRGRTREGRSITCLLSAEAVEVNGRPCLVTAVYDITERRRAEEGTARLEAQLRQSQKFEALGTLAGGIAHDFNNILTGILAYADLTGMDLDQPDEARKHLVQLRRASERARELVRQILAFSRPQKQERRPVKLHLIVQEALKLLRSTLPATIEIDASICPGAPVVLADPTQIHQVIMNLCTNAAHAMRDRAGRLTVKLEAVTLDGTAPRRATGLRPGRYARLSVADTGHGMDAATLGRIFEPFFTTKEPGEGTGLGLVVVHGIVREHEGDISVESEVGVGTTFCLHFPEHHAPIDDEVGSIEELPRGRGEAVLFIDDEEILCDSARQMLMRLGYRVTTHADPCTALAEFRERAETFAVVICDFTMPKMTGIELTRELLAVRPGVPVIMTTGFNGMWTPAAVHAAGLRELLHKPLVLADLSRAVRGAIDEAGLVAHPKLLS